MTTTLRSGAPPPALALRRAEEPMPALGASVTIRELMRTEWRAVISAREACAFVADDGQRYISAEGLDIAAATTLAFGAIDPETGEALWQPSEVAAWPRRPELWADVHRVAEAILALSEVGPEATKSGDPPPDAGGGEQPG